MSNKRQKLVVVDVSHKRKRDSGYSGQLTPFRNARYKRSRSAGGYTRSKRRSAYSRGVARAAVSLGVEKKFYDTSATANIVAPTDCTGGEVDPSGGLNCLSAPAQDDTASGRDGRKIVAKYIQLKGSVRFSTATNQTLSVDSNRLVVAVVLDTQTNGAQLNSEDVFTNPRGATTAADAPLRNLNFGERFKILKMEHFVLEDPNMTYDGTNVEINGKSLTFDWYIPLKNLKIAFTSGVTAGVANVLDNSIHVIAFATSTSPQCAIVYNARMRFVG